MVLAIVDVAITYVSITSGLGASDVNFLSTLKMLKRPGHEIHWNAR